MDTFVSTLFIFNVVLIIAAVVTLYSSALFSKPEDASHRPRKAIPELKSRHTDRLPVRKKKQVKTLKKAREINSENISITTN